MPTFLLVLSIALGTTAIATMPAHTPEDVDEGLAHLVMIGDEVAAGARHSIIWASITGGSAASLVLEALDEAAPQGVDEPLK